jgi:hypothetical protein
MTPRVSCRQIACLISLLCLAVSVPAVAGPVSPLYFTMIGGGDFVGELQGSAVLNLWPQSVGLESAIALPGSVRTMPLVGWGSNGAEYTFTGVPTGVTHPGPGFGPWIDGTTDGTYNYAVTLSSGAVYRFSNTWDNPLVLFGCSPYCDGITYDPSNNSLWLSNPYGTAVPLIENRSMSGALLFSFPAYGSQCSSKVSPNRLPDSSLPLGWPCCLCCAGGGRADLSSAPVPL